jgi:hypothetical protein
MEMVSWPSYTKSSSTGIHRLIPLLEPGAATSHSLPPSAIGLELCLPYSESVPACLHLFQRPGESTSDPVPCACGALC